MDKREVLVQVRMKRSGVDRIDQLRGEMSRSEWIRNACADAAAQGRTYSRQEKF